MKLIKQLSPFIILLVISSCSLLEDTISPSTSSSSKLCAHDNGDYYQCSEMNINKERVATSPNKGTDSGIFHSKVNFQLLSEYTEQMSIDIKNDVKGMHINKPIIVASFVYFDDNLKSTSALGNQLAEYLLTDMQEIGLPVIDHKLTSFLTITSEGDFSLSRNIDELNPDIEIGYVLTGTMVKNSNGIVVNARLISRDSGHIIASTSKLLPNIIISHTM